jgi:pimeloyl-ACP methyl ester carboxylesterase
MQLYRDISIDQMSADFEKVREHLQISEWLVFGGSWGSTLGLDYAERYASVCLGLIVRGIYLNTKPEFDAIYSRSRFLADARRLAEFDTWQELAVAEAKRNDEPPL